MSTPKNALDQWMNQAGRYDPLSKDEVIKICRKIQAAKPESRYQKMLVNKICLHNLKLVIMIVKRYIRRQNGLAWADNRTEDLLQQGYMGLRCAALRFDPTRGYAFSTYAYMWIQQAVGRYYMEDLVIRVPEHQRREAYNVLIKGKPREGQESNMEKVFERITSALTVSSVNRISATTKQGEEGEEIINVLSYESSIFDTGESDHEPVIEEPFSGEQKHKGLTEEQIVKAEWEEDKQRILYGRRLNIPEEIQKAGISKKNAELLTAWLMSGNLEKACSISGVGRWSVTNKKIHEMIDKVKAYQASLK